MTLAASNHTAPSGVFHSSRGPADFCIEWNAENQLRRVTKDFVEVATFKYDPLGRRIAKSAGGVTKTYAYDGDDILRETTSDGTGTTTHVLVHGPEIDEPLAREDTATNVVTSFHADGLGSIVKVTDALGVAVDSREYGAWGNMESGDTQSGYAFTGREWDPATGLHYYRARYYDSNIGRFISEDPVQFLEGVIYSYTRGRPTTARDPSGMQIELEWGRQADGSYRASIEYIREKIQEASDRGEPAFFASRADRGSHQCVALVKRFSGAPNTRRWRRGPAVWQNKAIRPGTAIATFGADGTYPQGDVDKNSAIFVRQEAGRIVVIDQWVGHEASERYIDSGDSPSNNAPSYYVILGAEE